jgi:hypothetical protein
MVVQLSSTKIVTSFLLAQLHEHHATSICNAWANLLVIFKSQIFCCFFSAPPYTNPIEASSRLWNRFVVSLTSVYLLYMDPTCHRSNILDDGKKKYLNPMLNTSAPKAYTRMHSPRLLAAIGETIHRTPKKTHEGKDQSIINKKLTQMPPCHSGG